MSEKTFILEIFSPDKKVFSGEVNLATFPGEKGLFTVLYNHAPLISVLTKGNVRWVIADKEDNVAINGGFVEINENKITACVEIL